MRTISDSGVEESLLYDGVLNEFCDLQECILKNAPPKSILRTCTESAIKTLDESRGRDGETDFALDDMSEAVDAFASLPATERKIILNGWEPPGRRIHEPQLSREDRAYRNAGTFLSMEIHADGKAQSQITEFFHDSSWPARIMFRLGTTKDAALKALADAMHHVQARWPDIITGAAPDLDAPKTGEIVKEVEHGE